MNKIYLRHQLSLDKELKGEIKGIAYSGAVIKNHGPFENLIIDLATLTVAKSKIPLLRDHMPFQVAGNTAVEITKDVSISGFISRKSQYGKEILDLAEDGFDWEMSLGVFEGQLEEIVDTEVNGQMITKGIALRNGIIREISVVALGADMNTKAEMFNIKKGEPSFMFTKEQWIKFACGCGGTQETTPEELTQKFAASEEKVKELEGEIEAMKAALADKEKELADIKDAEEMAARKEEISAAVKEKGIEFSSDKIIESAKTKESTELLLSFIKEMKKVEPVAPTKKVIDAKFASKTDVGGANTVKGDTDSVRLMAEMMVKEGKATDFIEALSMLEVK